MYSFLDLVSPALPLEALGVEDNNIIGDDKLKSSTALQRGEAWRGRLYGDRSWTPERKDPAPSLNITLDAVVNITYIATQGSPTEDCWATTFRIHYKMQGAPLKEYPEVCIMVTCDACHVTVRS